MNIGSYTFDEFCRLAENFHGYAAPGVLIGGYMVEKAKAALPPGTLFEAVAESPKCLPDAVQLLTLCSTGNQRLKIHNLGRYAVSLFDKHDGRGVRVSLDSEEMAKWPELYAWFFKKKPKKEQDSAKLLAEIEAAGDSICRLEAVTVRPRFVGARKMAHIAVCPICGEAYPGVDGPICRGCQGEAPYMLKADEPVAPTQAPTRVLPVEEAVGKLAAHDMTRIEPGQFKGPEFQAGQRISAGDVCRLQQMGRFNVAVLDESSESHGAPVHENEAAEAFAKRMAGPGLIWNLPPKEGKIDFRAEYDGLFCVDLEKLRNFNLVPQVMAACRQNATLVKKDAPVAGERAIPLFLDRKNFALALDALSDGPLFEVKKLRKARAGIIVTGTEVFKGLIEDKFIPIISAKLVNLGSEVAESAIVPDDREALRAALAKMLDAGVDMILTTGGLSVDPDDITRQSLLEYGLKDVVHGIPVLPGTMSLYGTIEHGGREVQVLGVPACALYYKTTFLDLVLPRLLAGLPFTRKDAVALADGGYCLNCRVCAWPKCGFGK